MNLIRLNQELELIRSSQVMVLNKLSLDLVSD